ncbi:sensor domain-containing diguanylate cyclase [Bradyrhizobium sp. USDA 4502]
MSERETLAFRSPYLATASIVLLCAITMIVCATAGMAPIVSLLVLALLAAAVVIAAATGWRSANRQRTLSDEIRNFKLIAERSTDMVIRFAFDGRILYVSPSCIKITGWSADQLLGTDPMKGINSEDMPHCLKRIDALRSGEVEETKIVHRQRRKDGSEIWVESCLAVTRAPANGKIDGAVAIVRDVTEHKDLQRELSVRANSDGLTGLANRRYFDEYLADEWAKAAIDGRPLSLLLLDVDHFKCFNDRYGHQAGDECLKEVGRLLRAASRRPGDLAARYGGEEFALLLPDTDAGSCERIGERLRTSLERLHIRHEGNHPHKIATVSVGATSIVPSAEESRDSLVEAADKALYQAKGSGRNRIILFGQTAGLPDALSA